jgi:xylulokinase
MSRDLILAIDVGTGSVRAALVDRSGNVVSIRACEHDQIVPAYGWSEQRPRDWWTGVVGAIRAVLDSVDGARARITSVAACGQMHGTVLVDQNGELVRETVPLWNDKRTASRVADFEARFAPSDYLADCANPATPAWPGFKLQWIRDHDAEAYRRAAAVMMPKDYINFRLTGEVAVDRTDAACSFLMDPATGEWSKLMCERLGLDIGKLPQIRMPVEILGRVTEMAAHETGLSAGLPVLVGGGDYPVALLGSGVCRPGVGSDVTGTSSIITLVSEKPLLDPEICNVGTPEGNWGAFMLLESGGDAVRWVRRAFHEKAFDYDEIVSKAVEAPAGCERLFFVPYLVGERLGKHRNARAQFFGITAGHGLAHLHRAVLEGVAFAVKRHIRVMEMNSGRTLERIIASGGGAKTALWLEIKASAYGIPILVPQEPECGVVGCAILAATAEGYFSGLEQGAGAWVRYADEVAPDPRLADTYARMQPMFEKLYRHSQALYDDLDRLA